MDDENILINNLKKVTKILSWCFYLNHFPLFKISAFVKKRVKMFSQSSYHFKLYEGN